MNIIHEKAELQIYKSTLYIPLKRVLENELSSNNNGKINIKLLILGNIDPELEVDEGYHFPRLIPRPGTGEVSF